MDPTDPETRRRRSGKPRPLSVRRKISRAQKLVWKNLTAEERAQRIEANRQAQNRPDVKEKRSAAAKTAQSDPEVRRRIGERVRQAWKTPRVRQRMLKAIRSHPAREKKSAGQKQYWRSLDRKKREQRVERASRAAAVPEVREKRLEGLRRSLATRKVRRERSKVATQTWADSQIRQHRVDGMLRVSGERRRKLAEAELILAAHKESKRGRGRRPTPKEQSEYFIVGQHVELEIPEGLKENKDAIVRARRIVSERTGRFVDTVAQYHKKYRQVMRAMGRSLPLGPV